MLTVKEGAVAFFNALGAVQATAMTESSARADAAPTEPKRLQSLQVFQLTDSHTWVVTTAPLSWTEATERLAFGGGSAGLKLLDFPITTLPAGATAATNEVRVVSVNRSSPAELAGLQMGDVVIRLDGQPVSVASQIEKAILLRPNGQMLLSLQRLGEAKNATLTPRRQPSVVPGPALPPALQTRVSEATPGLLEKST